jgi:hypothetical protein
MLRERAVPSRRYDVAGVAVALVGIFVCAMIPGRVGSALPGFVLVASLLAGGVLLCLGRWEDFKAERRERRALEGLCTECGYDLLLSRQRCPECGHPISPALRYPALVEFFEGWFAGARVRHAASADDLLLEAARLEPNRVEIAQELRRFLAEGYTDGEAARALLRDFHCDYQPERHGPDVHGVAASRARGALAAGGRVRGGFGCGAVGEVARRGSFG